MKLYYSDIRGADEARALYPPLSGSHGSAFGAFLLAAAYADYVGSGALPLLKRLLGGKPIFGDDPNLHFSISHSRTHVFCALSRHPVGVDTQEHRQLRPGTVEKLCTPQELSGLDFFEIWTLRESFFKLRGSGDLRTLRFYRQEGRLVPPEDGVFCHLYSDIEGSSTAVCSESDSFPSRLIKIPIEQLLKKPEKQPRTIINIKKTI